jgi:hypothetical protein
MQATQSAPDLLPPTKAEEPSVGIMMSVPRLRLLDRVAIYGMEVRAWMTKITGWLTTMPISDPR